MPDDEHKVLGAQLVEAVKAGSLIRVQELLAAGADPNYWAGGMGETPLHYAAEEPVAKALLAAGADPDRKHFTTTPLVAATLAGHDEVARLIHEQSTLARTARISEQMRSLGLSSPGEADQELCLAGTEPVDDLAHVVELSRVERPVNPDFPRTTLEGWFKQLDAPRIQPLCETALQAGLPLFLDLNAPPEELLQVMAERGAQPSQFRRRTRRFAGDELLPRSRYYTLSKDANGEDAGTLLREMWAYSHIARTGKIDLIDTADPAASERLGELGLKTPAEPSVVLVFLPGPDSGLSPFLMSNGLPQRVVAFPLPVKVTYERIENVVDLRLPETADKFARAVSQAVLEAYSSKTDPEMYFKCWPLRPSLETFRQLLPAMLTQELGGGVLSVAAGVMLRQAGVDGLVFPSARNDPFLSVKDGVVRRSQGWNFVDYREAPPPRRTLVLDVDRSWPDKVRLGPGFDLRKGPGADLFSNVDIDYTDEGPGRGSFDVTGIVKTHDLLHELEKEGFRNEEATPAWWML